MTLYEKARSLGMFDDLICPQASCGAAMKIPHEAVTLEYGGIVRYDCPACGVSDCLGEDVLAEYVKDNCDDNFLINQLVAHVEDYRNTRPPDDYSTGYADGFNQALTIVRSAFKSVSACSLDHDHFTGDCLIHD